MVDFLNYILGQLTTNNFHIEETEEDDAFVYTITLDEADYPTIIGKRGLTIKAITALCRVKERSKPSLNGGRFFIKVNPNQSAD